MKEFINLCVGKLVNVELKNGTNYERRELTSFDGTYLTVADEPKVIHIDDIKQFTAIFQRR